MSADRLREAAQKIRDTTDAATGESWTHLTQDGQDEVWARDEASYVAQVGTHEDAAHIALWSPPVALAVADLLRIYAAAVSTGHPVPVDLDDQAERVAGLILGGGS